jgi:hypothetical protein
VAASPKSREYLSISSLQQNLRKHTRRDREAVREAVGEEVNFEKGEKTTWDI